MCTACSRTGFRRQMKMRSCQLGGMHEPALHIPRWRANIQCSDRKMVCLLKQKTSERRDGHCGNEVGTLRRDRMVGGPHGPIRKTKRRFSMQKCTLSNFKVKIENQYLKRPLHQISAQAD